MEIILIHVKGGGARNPSASDIKRLQAVSVLNHAKAVVLASSKKGSQPIFCRLRNLNRKSLDPKNAWQAIDPGILFR